MTTLQPHVPDDRAREDAAWLLRNGWTRDTPAAEAALAARPGRPTDPSKSSAMAHEALHASGQDVAAAIALLESDAPLT